MIDDVDDRAFSSHYSRDLIARLGVSSGADCFLCATRPESAFELIDAIERGVRSLEILPERIESARRRIAPLLHRYVKEPGGAPDLSCFADAKEATLAGFSLDPGVDASTHVSPGALAAHEKQHQH